MLTPSSNNGAHPRVVLLIALLSVLASIAICTAAILAPAPPAAVPVIVTFCVGCPLFAAWEAPFAVNSLRMRRAGDRALATLRQSLAQLPEVEHPLGL